MTNMEKKTIMMEKMNDTFEISIKGMNDNLESNIQNVHHTIYNVILNTTTMLKELLKQQRQLHITEFLNLQSEIDHLKRISAQTEERLNELDISLHHVHDKTNVPLVMFKAYSVKTDTDLAGQVIKFKGTNSYFGNGFHTTTGYFTAPIAGVYIFTLQICTEKDNTFETGIFVRGSTLAKLIAYQNFKDGPCISTTGFASLSKGDKAWIKCHSADSGDSVYTGDAGNFFTGVLIHK